MSAILHHIIIHNGSPIKVGHHSLSGKKIGNLQKHIHEIKLFDFLYIVAKTVFCITSRPDSPACCIDNVINIHYWP